MTKITGESADIVVRGIEINLVRRVRADAILNGQDLKTWIEDACRSKLKEANQIPEKALAGKR